MTKLNRLYQCIILFVYSVIMFYIIGTGIFSKLVHPRMLPYTLIFAFVVFGLAFVGLKNINFTQYRKLKISDLIYVLPVIFILFINNGNLSTNMKLRVNPDSKAIVSNVITKTPGPILETTDDSAEVTENTGTVELKDDRYLDILTDIQQNNDKYIGETITAKGFIYRDPTMKSSEFLLGRLALYCCIADVEVTGLLCESSEASGLTDNEWVEITGKIDKVTLKDEDTTYTTPYIHVTDIRPIEKPEQEYVYFK